MDARGTNQYVDDPARQCVGKHKFSTKRRAKRFLRAQRHMQNRGDLMAYLCPHCGYYHLGTRPGVKAKRRAKSARMRYTDPNAATTGGGESENSP